MIKNVAVLSMVLDHVGLVFFPHIAWFRVVGRLAMPLFAYSMSKAFDRGLNNESFESLYKYFFRILMLSIASQVPFSLITGNPHLLNIGFTWILGFLLLLTYTRDNSFFGWFVICLTALLAYFLNADYGLYGALYPLMFYVCISKKHKFNLMLVGSALLFLLYSFSFGVSVLQAVSILAVLIIMLLDNYDHVLRFNKWFYYSFYPAHMLVLVIIRFLI